MKRPVVASGAMEFQADLDRLVVEPLSVMLRAWPFLGAALVIALGLVAALTRIDIVVTATGRLAADAPPVILQPLSRAVLKELLVRPGDQVVAGQILARLDSTLTDADRAALQIERRSLAAQLARLQSDMTGAAMISSDAEQALQAQVQMQRSDLAAAQRDQLKAAEVAVTQAIQTERAAEPGLTDRRYIALQIEAMRDKLAQSQSGTQLQAMEARLTRIDAETALNAHFARLDDLAQRLDQARAALLAFEIDIRRRATEDYAAVAPKLAEVVEQLTKADRVAALADLRAPRPGVVLSVAKGGPGSLIGEGEVVVVLVPTDVALIAEIGVRSSEAGSIAMGDPVTVKIDAFPWRRNGMLQGRLQDVSHGSFTPEGTTSALHSGRVTLSGALTNLPPGAQILPGMTLTAEIKTGTRTVLDYFLDPLMRGMTESLREP
ncbi:MAG: HlyD family type I secretion periplasmic adaptor subunit [Candidatus Saccharibacteria bacterium]|nr:HlyD family type I secretion periplasmic adaptor subunit [Pseudorhodobacter sp.]